MLKQNDVKPFENGVISGLAGVLLNEGVARDFDVATLLSEAHADYPDARAAAAIMTVIDRLLLHVELDLKPLLKEAALIEETLKEIIPNTWDWISNPIDGSILEWKRPEALLVLQALAASPEYDVVLANVRWIEFMVGREDGDAFEKTLEQLKDLATENGKATMFVLGDSESPDEQRRHAVVRARRDLADAGVALYPDIERAAHTLGRYVDYFGRRGAT